MQRGVIVAYVVALGSLAQAMRGYCSSCDGSRLIGLCNEGLCSSIDGSWLIGSSKRGYCSSIDGSRLIGSSNKGLNIKPNLVSRPPLFFVLQFVLNLSLLY